MNGKTLSLLTVALWLIGTGFAGADDDKDSRGGGMSLARRLAALESIVARQSDQIGLLRKALDREVAARKTADATLQSRIDNIQPSAFSPAQVSTLQGIAAVTSVERTNIYIGGNICVGGDVAVRQGHTLFVSHVQPSNGDCGGNAADVTIFDGNVGIQATNTLFVNNLRAFQAIPPSPAEAQEMGVGLGFGVILLDPAKDNIIVSGPLLFRTLRY
jgi:hypothetical protein